MTFGQFQLFAEGYRVREARRWEPFRLVIATQHAAAGNSVSPSSIMTLYTDTDNYGEEEVKNTPLPMTKEQVLQWATIFDETKWISN